MYIKVIYKINSKITGWKRNGIILYRNRVYFLNSSELSNLILKETHHVLYVGNIGYEKTIATIKSQHFWLGMNKEVDDYIVKCLECQKFKADHKHPIGFLHPFPIPK